MPIKVEGSLNMVLSAGATSTSVSKTVETITERPVKAKTLEAMTHELTDMLKEAPPYESLTSGILRIEISQTT